MRAISHVRTRSTRCPGGLPAPEVRSPRATRGSPEEALGDPDAPRGDAGTRPRLDSGSIGRPSRPAGRGAQALRRRRGGGRDRPRDRRRRVLLDARPVRLGQDDDPADDRRLRAADRGPGHAPRRGREPARAVRARREHGLPGLRPVPAHDRRGQRGLRPDDPQGAAMPIADRQVADALRDGPARGLREAQAVAAVGRPAPAGRARPGARQPAAGAPPRRAARRARPQAARGDADRAEGDPAPGRDHVHLRDPRPGGGAHDERPGRGLQPRPDRAGRHPGRGLRATRDRLRGRLRGHLEPAHAARWPSGSSGRAGTFTVRPEKIRLADPAETVA